MSMQYLDSELRFMWLLHALKPGGGGIIELIMIKRHLFSLVSYMDCQFLH